jgi:hypothetical protein
MRFTSHGPARLAVVLVALAGSVVPARADELRRLAAEQFELAAAAEKRGDLRGAVVAYQRAYAIVPHADVLYNLARLFEKLGDWSAAAEHYRRYLDEGGDAADRREVEGRIAALRTRAGVGRPIAGEPGGELVIQSNVPGAEVLVDGETVGVTPLQRPAAAGRRTVTVTHPGFEATTMEVDLPSGGVRVVRADLRPIPITFGFTAGLSAGYEHVGKGRPRFMTSTGFRPVGSRLEGNLLFVFAGDASIGLEVRVHARPEPGGLYGRAAGTGGLSFSGGRWALGSEAALGFAWEWSSGGPGVGLALEGGLRLLRLSAGLDQDPSATSAGPLVQAMAFVHY